VYNGYEASGCPATGFGKPALRASGHDNENDRHAGPWTTYGQCDPCSVGRVMGEGCLQSLSCPCAHPHGYPQKLIGTAPDANPAVQGKSDSRLTLHPLATTS